MKNGSAYKCIIILLVFYIAGTLCRLFDEVFPVYSLSLFIFSAAALFWALSLRIRITQIRQRCLLIAIAAMVLLMHLLQILRADFAYTQHQQRFIWYLYHIPMTLAPLFSMWAASEIGKPEDEEPDSKYLFLIIPAAVLICLVLTNDYHQLMFRYTGGSTDPDLSYTRGILYYITGLWDYGLVLLALAVATRRYSRPSSKRRVDIPIMIFAVGINLFLIIYGSTSNATRVPVVSILSFQMIWHMIFVLFWESCIAIGLIPTNSFYDEIFRNASVSAQIFDLDKKCVYSSADTAHLPDEVIKNMGMFSFAVFVSGSIKYCFRRIRGGYICWREDISAIQEINSMLADSARRRQEENDLILRESELKAEKARVETYSRLYDEIAEDTQNQINEIKSLLDDIIGRTDFVFKRGIRKAVVLTAYVKRRANLMLIQQNDSNIRALDLKLAIKESLEYAAFSGITGEVILESDDTLPAQDVLIAYELFELILERGYSIIGALMVLIKCNESVLTLEAEASKGAGITNAVWSGLGNDIGVSVSGNTGYRFITIDDGYDTLRFKVVFADPVPAEKEVAV